MVPANPPDNYHSQNPRQPFPTLTHPENPTRPDALRVSTVSSDYKLEVAPSTQGLPLSVDSGISLSLPAQGGQMEMEDNTKAHAFSAPKQNIKKCIRSYQTLPPKTRQTLKITGIGVASILALLAIFYIARLSEQHEFKGETVFVEHEVQNQVEVSIKSGSYADHENQSQSEYQMSQNIKIVKDEHGKAKQLKMFPKRRLPLFPNLHEKRAQMSRYNWNPANETEIAETLDLVRRRVDADRKKISNKELRLWEPGADPLRVLLVSTWRAGSTFLGQLLQSHPGVFQHYEPLSYIGLHQVRSGKEAFQAQQVLHRLLDCKYDNLEEYVNFTRLHARDMIGHNRRVWNSCQEGPNERACIDARFLSSACKMFPIQLVKTVRLRLNLTQLLLNDQKLRVKVIFLVRDPRGIMNSRYSSVSWCLNNPDCSSAETLCQDMQGDLKVAAAFEKLYPDRFLKIKYEDLAGNPQDVSKILSFLGLEFSDSIKDFISENTTKNKDSPWSIQRKSSDRITIWKKQLPLQEIHAVQDACGAVLKTLKYEILGS